MLDQLRSIVNKTLRYAFFICIIRPFVWLVLGLRVRDRQNLPDKGPAIICANHNSHLDTIVLMSLLPISRLHLIHPAAKAAYWWDAGRWIRWFGEHIIGVVPAYRYRGEGSGDPLRAIYPVLEEGKILLFFPEGSRGEPEQLRPFKRGLVTLGERFPDVPIIPVYMHGMGKSWPRGSRMILPFICDVYIGRAITYQQSPHDLLARFGSAIEQLARQGNFPEWLPKEATSNR